MKSGKILTIDTIPIYEKPITLSEIIEENVDYKYQLNDEKISKFKYLRGPKKLKEQVKMDMNIIFQKVVCQIQILLIYLHVQC